MRYALLLCALLFTATMSARADKIKTSEDLIRAMQQKYAKSWYKTLTFKQKTMEFHEEGTKKESIWYEAMEVPGRLRLAFDRVTEGNGVQYANAKLYRFNDGSQA